MDREASENMVKASLSNVELDVEQPFPHQSLYTAIQSAIAVQERGGENPGGLALRLPAHRHSSIVDVRLGYIESSKRSKGASADEGRHGHCREELKNEWSTPAKFAASPAKNHLFV